jgi:hypothetical protein
MTHLLTIDPGVTTGIALGKFDEHQAYERVAFWAVKEGLEGFIHWYHAEAPIEALMGRWVAERFVLRDNDFVANTEPLRIEGAMEAFGLHPIYQLRTDKALAKDQVLKDAGLWVTGKMCGHTDGRDVNDATIHALAYLKKLRHIPTLRRYWS